MISYKLIFYIDIQTYTVDEFILGSGVQDLSCAALKQDKSCIPSSFLRGHSPIKMAQMT